MSRVSATCATCGELYVSSSIKADKHRENALAKARKIKLNHEAEREDDPEHVVLIDPGAPEAPVIAPVPCPHGYPTRSACITCMYKERDELEYVYWHEGQGILCKARFDPRGNSWFVEEATSKQWVCKCCSSPNHVMDRDGIKNSLGAAVLYAMDEGAVAVAESMRQAREDEQSTLDEEI